MSSLDQPHAGVLRFGVFEVDLAAHELRKRGVRIKLQEQPFRVLEALLDEPGQVVTRDDLRHRIWADDEFVEFDKSLNTCIQKIRRVLGDSATSPRFVETLPKLGYRFIAPVERTQGTEGLPPASARALGGIPTKSVLGAVAASFVAALAVTVLLPESQPPAPRFTSQPLTYEPGSEQHPSLSPDGTRVAYEADGGDPTKSRIYVRLTDVRAGAPIEVTSGPWLDKEPSWSPDGSRLVFVRILEVRPNHLGSRFKLLLASPTLHAPTQELTDREFLARNPGGILPIGPPTRNIFCSPASSTHRPPKLKSAPTRSIRARHGLSPSRPDRESGIPSRPFRPTAASSFTRRRIDRANSGCEFCR